MAAVAQTCSCQAWVGSPHASLMHWTPTWQQMFYVERSAIIRIPQLARTNCGNATLCRATYRASSRIRLQPTCIIRLNVLNKLRNVSLLSLPSLNQSFKHQIEDCMTSISTGSPYDFHVFHRMTLNAALVTHGIPCFLTFAETMQGSEAEGPCRSRC